LVEKRTEIACTDGRDISAARIRLRAEQAERCYAGGQGGFFDHVGYLSSLTRHAPQ
jgi:hypothetical protein